MKKRLATSAVILIVTVGFVLLKMVSSLFFDVFALTISYACLYETLKAYKKLEKKPNVMALYFIPAIQFLIFVLADIKSSILLSILLAVGLLVYLLTNEIATYAKNRKYGLTEPNVSVLNSTLFDETKLTMKIFAYPLLPLSFLFALNHLPYEIGYIGIILIFVVAMLTDSTAYLVGRFWGKKKFIPEVSPNKTIAGVVGGFVGGIVGVLVCYFIFYYTGMFSVLNNFGKGVVVTAFLIIAVVGSYANQLGDLVASALKRKSGLKDYSNIFPGHGGFMDRVDGLMFVAVVVYTILSLFFV